MSSKRLIPLDVLKQYFRVPAGHVDVEYDNRTPSARATLANISLTGAFVRTENPLPEDTHLTLTFCLPNGRRRLRVPAVVCWCDKGEQEHRPPGMGVTFERLGKAEQREIKRYVGNFLGRMRRRET